MFDSEVVSSATTSKEINVGQTDLAAIDVVWSASSLVADVKVEAQTGDDSAWREVDISGTPAISGASGDHQIIFNELPFTKIRLSVGVTSGSGTITATISTKSKGA